MLKHFTLEDIQKMNRNYRRDLINGISGFKSANLIGTQNKAGRTNLAIFNSIHHIGANPPLMGFILRPTTVIRHTYENIMENDGYYTVNLVSKPFIRQAHQTSAKYPAESSEFNACGFTPEYINDFPAPFVQECLLKVGLQFEEEHLIKANDTRLIIGKVLHLILPKSSISINGFIDLESMDIIAVRGLDSYYEAKKITRLSYARPDQNLSDLED